MVRDIKNLDLQDKLTNKEVIIIAQDKQIFWQGFEIWGYRIGIAIGIALLVFR